MSSSSCFDGTEALNGTAFTFDVRLCMPLQVDEPPDISIRCSFGPFNYVIAKSVQKSFYACQVVEERLCRSLKALAEWLLVRRLGQDICSEEGRSETPRPHLCYASLWGYDIVVPYSSCP